ncbi:unnamed protein product [Caenorhabditis angaria]|uniref:SET domain-containing protein n=1 Tax=Caenorhabditis angaria TaxID=860376 RepID=A0A9P1IK00_9PELO|nr:unnamed protein product [Caenorhabditis angaria]
MLFFQNHLLHALANETHNNKKRMAEAPPQTEAPLATEPPSNLQENQEEEAPIQVIIDSESEDEARAEEAHFKRNGGLPYDDHNYGNLELKNRGNDEEDEQPFPIIGPLDEYGNVLPIAPPQPPPPHQTHFHPRAAAPNQPKQYNAHFISSSGDHHHHHFAPTRNEPSIVARAPATNSYRVTTESGVGGASGYQAGGRTILQQTRQIMRPRAELSQSGQPIYTQVHHHQPGTLRAQPAGSGTNINSPMIPRRQPPQQQGQPGAYQHIVQTTPAGLIRRTIPQRPAILGQANRGIAATAGSVAAAAAGGEHYSPVHRRMADVAPHRMTQEQRLQQQASLRPPPAPLPPPPQQISAPQQPQQFTNLEGVAPMLVPARGSRLLVRGRAGSHGQKRREDGTEMILQESPAKAAAPQADADSPAKMGAVKPPHRMSQEEKNAHIAKHLEKDKMPDPIAAATAENNVASVVLAVAEAVNAANLGGARPSTLPTPSTSTPTNNTQQTAKEKDEITRLANDIRLSCESFVPAPPPTSSSAHQTPSKSHQNGWNSSQNGGGATDKELTEARVKQHIETARKQLEEEGNLQHQQQQQQNMVPMIGAERKRAVSSFLAGLTPNDQPARQRGRPKGSTGTRNRWSTSSNQQDAPIPPGNVVRIGQGVRTMPAQPPIAHPLPLPLPLTHPLAPIPSAHLPAVQMHQPPPINSPGVNKDSDSESDGVKQGGESGGDFGDDWTMRCHCEMSHGDGHCVECEKCGNWQHTLCMGLKPSEADKMNNYQCEVCQPRILSVTKTEARKIQKRELDRLRKATAKKEKKSGGARKSLPKDATKRRSLTASALTKPDPPPYSDANDYSRTAQRLLKTLGATSGASGLLEDAKSRTRAKRMFVEENIEGLVSTAPVDPRQVIIELSGYVCRPEETTREAGGIAGVYQYDGLMKGPTGEDIGPSTGNELICIDAKKKGNDSRYTRRSCQPNCVLKHVLDEKGILGVMIVATRFIPYNTEITLPFDNDWRQRKNKLTCADHFGEESTNCGPEIERARLNPPILNVPQPPKRPAIFDSILKNEEDLVDAAQRADIQRKEREAAKQSATPKTTPKVVAPKPPPKARAVSLEKSPSVGRKSEEGEKKLSREERRTQQYEILFSRQEEEAKKKESKRKSTGKTAEKKEKSVEKELKEEEPKIEPKEEEKIPETPEKPAEKRTSARRVSAKIAESTPTRELSARQKKKRLESEAESEASASASISKTTTTSATVPPLKRWKAEAAKESAQNQKVESPMVFKKQWMKRHIAEVVSEVSPSKKTRRSSVEKFTFGEIRAQFRENARLVAEKLGKQWYDPSSWMTKEDKVSRKVRNMIEDQRKQDEEKERRERREKRESESERRKKAEETVEKNEEEAEIEKVEETQMVREQEVAAAPTTSKIVAIEEEAKKVTRKRLSVAEYKMRKSGNLPTGIYHGPIDTSSSQKDESPVSQKPSSSGFIPSTEGASGQNLAQLPFVAPPSPPKSFYPPPTGVVLEDPRLLRESARYAPPPPPPPPPRGSQHLPRTPPHPSSSSSSSKPPSTVTQSADESPRMSLKDRLFSEFGLGSGSPSSSTRKQSPPPPPPTRSRASRWQ